MIALCSAESWSRWPGPGKDSLRGMTEEPDLATRMGQTLDGALGFEVLEAGEELARGASR